MIAIIDYKMGNLRSVAKALEKIGAEVLVTSKPKDLRRAEAIVLPGVGAFGQGMKHLRELGVISCLLDEVKKGKPLLGICLGLQLLFSKSYEHGMHKGLDLIKGEVKRFPQKLKVPHMGWNQVSANRKPLTANRNILKDIPNNFYFYFVHSYFVVPEDKSVIVATTDYGVEFASVIQKDNIWGVQFHPEKSQELGLKILQNFVDLVGKAQNFR
jgi:glutamine amidotransferase